jgi:hypothetical protein
LGASPTPQKRKEWISALDKIESLNPWVVVAGHKRPGTDDDPRIIEETRQYIRDFDRLAESTDTTRELYDQMLKLYPNGSNPHILWLGALAAKSRWLSLFFDLAVQTAVRNVGAKFVVYCVKLVVYTCILVHYFIDIICIIGTPCCFACCTPYIGVFPKCSRVLVGSTHTLIALGPISFMEIDTQ